MDLTGHSARPANVTHCSSRNRSNPVPLLSNVASAPITAAAIHASGMSRPLSLCSSTSSLKMPHAELPARSEKPQLQSTCKK